MHINIIYIYIYIEKQKHTHTQTNAYTYIHGYQRYDLTGCTMDMTNVNKAVKTVRYSGNVQNDSDLGLSGKKFELGAAQKCDLEDQVCWCMHTYMYKCICMCVYTHVLDQCDVLIETVCWFLYTVTRSRIGSNGFSVFLVVNWHTHQHTHTHTHAHTLILIYTYVIFIIHTQALVDMVFLTQHNVMAQIKAYYYTNTHINTHTHTLILIYTYAMFIIHNRLF
jgi:hypothetical protein